MITYVFPGQGSQSKGMGKMLFDEFKELTQCADEILGYSIKELCLEDPYSNLSQTQFTQPALFVVSALSYLKKIQETGYKPDFVAGHSLGEYNALFAAGAFDFGTGLELIKKRSNLMSKARGGGMAAIIGLNEEEVKDVLAKNGINNIDIANYNTPYQIVISGLKEDIVRAKPVFEAVKEVRMYVQLKVSGAFHSRYMSEARQEFEKYVQAFQINNLSIPVISNVYARPYREEDIKTNLAKQIDSPIKWTESIRYLMGKGNIDFEEIGPGKVLTGMITRIKKEAEPLIVVEEEKTKSIVRENIEQNVKSNNKITPFSLGDKGFKKDYNLKYAYLTGAMYRGIASKEMVVKVGKAGMMGFLGTGGMKLSQIESDIKYIKQELSHGQAYGMNLIHNANNPEKEEKTVDLYLRTGVRTIEAAAFLGITPALVKFRAKGLIKDHRGNIVTKNKTIAKVSRPEVAEAFLSPSPDKIVRMLVSENKITQEEAELISQIPMCDDICVEADSGGHTDGGVAYALMPSIIELRNQMMKKYNYKKSVRVGAAGGIGTPQAAAAAFMLGADFILTGSINQCTVEADISSSVKELLQQMNVQDTEYAPAGDMFEIGAKVQVLRKSLFFPSRANKLYDLYRKYNSIEEIDEKTKRQIQDKYFKQSFERIYQECKDYHPSYIIEKAEKNSKYKMALIFKWYFKYSSDLAINGDEKSKVDYQINCGPALGSFNQLVKGTSLENWRNRYVDEIGIKIMNETAEFLNNRFKILTN